MCKPTAEPTANKAARAFGPDSRRKPTWSTSHDQLRLDYWRLRWCNDNDDGFRYRGHSFSVTACERVVAGGRFEEWDCPPGCDLTMDSFVLACDEHSQATYDMAEAVVASFCRTGNQTGSSPFDYGSIVLFDRLRIEAVSANESRVVWHLIKVVLSRVRRAGAAGVILKAFPLEYEGKVTGDNRNAFELRQRAMLRHYSRHLGTRTLPGGPGRSGWQWLPMKCPFEPIEL
jgi:hypothetical protein